MANGERDDQGSTLFDPDKIWLSLEYSDSIKVGEKKLKELLCALNCGEGGLPGHGPDDYSIEWTLSARTNCIEDEPPTPVTTSDLTECHDDTCSANQVNKASTQPTLTKSSSIKDRAVNGFFCLTAPVKTEKKISPEDPHCVLEPTDTILVEMRYKFNHYDPSTPGYIARQLIPLIKEKLVCDESSKCKVYVFKHEVCNIGGISPSPSTNRLDPSSIIEEGDPLSIIVEGDPLSVVVEGDPLSVVVEGDPLSIVEVGDPLAIVEEGDPPSIIEEGVIPFSSDPFDNEATGLEKKTED